MWFSQGESVIGKTGRRFETPRTQERQLHSKMVAIKTWEVVSGWNMEWAFGVWLSIYPAVGQELSMLVSRDDGHGFPPCMECLAWQAFFFCEDSHEHDMCFLLV